MKHGSDGPCPHRERQISRVKLWKEGMKHGIDGPCPYREASFASQSMKGNDCKAREGC